MKLKNYQVLLIAMLSSLLLGPLVDLVPQEIFTHHFIVVIAITIFIITAFIATVAAVEGKLNNYF